MNSNKFTEFDMRTEKFLLENKEIKKLKPNLLVF